jgi:hypothetical protein
MISPLRLATGMQEDRLGDRHDAIARLGELHAAKRVADAFRDREVGDVSAVV